MEKHEWRRLQPGQQRRKRSIYCADYLLVQWFPSSFWNTNNLLRGFSLAEQMGIKINILIIPNEMRV
jgi:hypothetical protein